jgi:hypothetical protein
LSKSCQTVVKKLSQKVVTIGPSNPKLEKPASSHLVKRRSDQEWRMKKLGIRRLDATSSHLVKTGVGKFPKPYIFGEFSVSLSKTLNFDTS